MLSSVPPRSGGHVEFQRPQHGQRNAECINNQTEMDSRHHTPGFPTSDLLSAALLLVMLCGFPLLLFLQCWLLPYFCQNFCKAVKAWQCLLLLVLAFVSLLFDARSCCNGTVFAVCHFLQKVHLLCQLLFYMRWLSRSIMLCLSRLWLQQDEDTQSLGLMLKSNSSYSVKRNLQ